MCRATRLATEGDVAERVRTAQIRRRVDRFKDDTFDHYVIGQAITYTRVRLRVCIAVSYTVMHKASMLASTMHDVVVERVCT